MLTEYINEAMGLAHYELLEDDKKFYGEIENFPGLWATGEKLEICRDALKEALEDWLMFALRKHTNIPPINGISLDNKALVNA